MLKAIKAMIADDCDEVRMCMLLFKDIMIMVKTRFCLGENKGADQLCSNCKADQRLCFRYMDSTIPFLLKSEISSFQPSAIAAQASLCQTLSKTLKTGFLASWLNLSDTLRMIQCVLCT